MRLIIYNVSRQVTVFANDDGGGFFYKTLEPPSSTYRGVKCTGQSINAQSALCSAKFSAISIMQCNVQCITECIGQSIYAQYAPASLCAPILVSLRTLIMYPQKIPLIVCILCSKNTFGGVLFFNYSYFKQPYNGEN